MMLSSIFDSPSAAVPFLFPAKIGNYTRKGKNNGVTELFPSLLYAAKPRTLWSPPSFFRQTVTKLCVSVFDIKKTSSKFFTGICPLLYPGLLPFVISHTYTTHSLSKQSENAAQSPLIIHRPKLPGNTQTMEKKHFSWDN